MFGEFCCERRPGFTGPNSSFSDKSLSVSKCSQMISDQFTGKLAAYNSILLVSDSPTDAMSRRVQPSAISGCTMRQGSSFVSMQVTRDALPNFNRQFLPHNSLSSYTSPRLLPKLKILWPAIIVVIIQAF